MRDMGDKAITTEWAWISSIEINHDANILYLDGVMYQPVLANVSAIQLIGNAARVASEWQARTWQKNTDYRLPSHVRIRLNDRGQATELVEEIA